MGGLRGEAVVERGERKMMEWSGCKGCTNLKRAKDRMCC